MAQMETNINIHILGQTYLRYTRRLPQTMKMLSSMEQLILSWFETHNVTGRGGFELSPLMPGTQSEIEIL